MNWTIGRYDINIKFVPKRRRARFWLAFSGPAYWYRQLGPLSITVEDAEAPVNAACGDCGSPSGSEGLKSVSCGDEGWTYCTSCEAIEPKIEYLSKRQLEKAGYEVY
jgi:hypothetical protein